ncbi:MAG: hypothetical protein MJ106_06105 [Lentisphaeria bacterium]|nr:hypothetical protein [Lentisphaeria bacterium]
MFSAWVRTENFQSSSAGFIIGNSGWTKSCGIVFPKATQDWTYMEQEVTMVESSGQYFACVYACRFTGEIDIADAKITALSEQVRLNTNVSNLATIYNSTKLVPWSPRFHQIDEKNPVVTFKLFGALKQAFRGKEIVLSASDTDAATVQPLESEMNTIALPAGARSGKLTAVIRDKKSGETIFKQDYPFSVVAIPKVEAGVQKRLNNFATEVLNASITATADAQEFHFSTLRPGWVFIAAQNAAAENLKIVLDDTLTVIDNATPRLENFRELPPGVHTLTVTGAENGGNILVNTVIETLNYCPGSDSMVPENPPYDWNFQMKYGMPAITTQNGGSIPEDKLEWFKAQGYHWLANQMSTELVNNADMTNRLNNSSGMNEARYDGVTCDEQFFSQPAILSYYTEGLKAYENPYNHVIYSWIVGKPKTPGIDDDFIATTVNSCGGRGKLSFEIYCPTMPTEEKAVTYFNNRAKDTVSLLKKKYPDIMQSMGIVLGNFNQIPILSLQHHPEVDYKYYLDLQMNILANDPEFKDLALTGYWGSYYADHELHRWSYMLLRHYCIEGNTAMLSDKYGFKYLPGHIVNGDFVGSFNGWTTKGNVSLDKFDDFASTSQNRWGGNNGVGDTFAVLSKKGDEISSVTQVAKNLIPGRTYLLEFCTFDVDDVKSKTVNGHDFGIRASLDSNAEINKGLSWHHIDTRTNGRYAHNNGVARPNLHHIVFTAKAPEVEITLSNTQAKAGENLGINFFRVIPYLLEE